MTVYKLIEVVGTSNKGVDDAVRGAIARARQTIDDLAWFEVKEIRGRIDHRDAPEFQVKLDIGFAVHAPTGRTKIGRPARSTVRRTRTTAPTLARKGGARKATGRGLQKQRRGGRA